MNGSDSGSYVPVCTKVDNIVDVSVQSAFWTREGNFVDVDIAAIVRCTAGENAPAQVDFSLPVPSDLVQYCDVIGHGWMQKLAPSDGDSWIMGDSANNRASMSFFSPGTNSRAWFLHFRYLIR